jgi:hypothetical protein
MIFSYPHTLRSLPANNELFRYLFLSFNKKWLSFCSDEKSLNYIIQLKIIRIFIFSKSLSTNFGNVNFI